MKQITHTLNIQSLLNIFLLIIKIESIWSIQSPNVVTTPCPHIFSYILDKNQQLYGLIHIPIDNPPNYRILNVTLSIGAELRTNYGGQLEPINESNEVKYKLHLPVTSPVPRIKEIYFNGNLICQGPPASGNYVTTIQLYNIVRREIISHKNPTYTNDELVYVVKNPPSYLATKPAITNNDYIYSNEQTNKPQNYQTFIPQDIVTKKPLPQLIGNVNDDLTEEVCGTTSATIPLVSKGVHIYRGEFPWLAAILVTTNNSINFICGGTLISHQHVVTAAHCVKENNIDFKASQLIVALGVHNIREWNTDPSSLVLEIEEIILHPEYNPYTLSLTNDIAVLRFVKKIRYTPYIRPICIWKGNVDLEKVKGRAGAIVGWGRDEFQSKITDEPRHTQIPIISQVDCVRINPNFAKYISDRTFCAGGIEFTGPCSGDSGAGFFLNEHNRWSLRGVVSQSLKESGSIDCSHKQYVIFADAAKYNRWLYDFVRHD